MLSATQDRQYHYIDSMNAGILAGLGFLKYSPYTAVAFLGIHALPYGLCSPFEENRRVGKLYDDIRTFSKKEDSQRLEEDVKDAYRPELVTHKVRTRKRRG